jgi:hypothetical protein
LNLRLKEYVLILSIGFSNPLWAGQCSIDIINERNSGEKVRLHFTSKLDNRQQCQKLAQMHRPNYDPNQVKLKIVTYEWSGPETKKTASSKKAKKSKLAKSKDLKQHHSRKF